MGTISIPVNDKDAIKVSRTHVDKVMEVVNSLSETRKTQEKAYRTDNGASLGDEGPAGGMGSGIVTLVCRTFGAESNCLQKFKTGNLVYALAPDTFIFQP